jgi:hypothetical protein
MGASNGFVSAIVGKPLYPPQQTLKEITQEVVDALTKKTTSSTGKGRGQTVIVCMAFGII